MQNKISAILALVTVMFFPVCAEAETIALKTGQKIDGKIIEKTDQMVMIEWNGIRVAYKVDEIESIDASFPQQSESQNIAVASPQKQEPEFDGDLLREGIRFIPPAGWKKENGGEDTELVKGYLYVQPENKAVIIVGVYQNQNANQVIFENTISVIRAKEKPFSEEKVIFLGVPCHVFTSNKESKKGRLGKVKTYLWLIETTVYILSYSSPFPFYDAYLPDFEKCLSTIEVTKK